jgi:predicted DNA-binding protein
MGRTLSVDCDDAMEQQISTLARDYGITEREVLRQLVEIGLEELEHIERPSRG